MCEIVQVISPVATFKLEVMAAAPVGVWSSEPDHEGTLLSHGGVVIPKVACQVPPVALAQIGVIVQGWFWTQ